MGALTRALAAAVVAGVLVLAPAAHGYALGPGTAPEPRDPLVSIEATGGFTGGTSDLIVGRHGGARLDNRQGSRHFHVSASRLTSLRRALRAAHWMRLHDDYPASRRISDGLHYTILYRSRAVRTEDGARRPRRLTRVLAILSRIAGRHGGFL